MGKILADSGVGANKKVQHLITDCNTLTQHSSQERFRVLDQFFSFHSQVDIKEIITGSQNVFQGRLEELFLHESDFCVRIPLRIRAACSNAFKYPSALVLEISIPGG